MDDKPELSVSHELLPEHVLYYQSPMGIIVRGMIELGRVNKSTEVSMLSLHMALPHQGHLEEALHVVPIITPKLKVVYGSNCLPIDTMIFQVCDWREFYGEVEESISPNAPEAIGRAANLCCLLIVIMQKINVHVDPILIFNLP